MDLKKVAVRACSGCIYVAIIVGCCFWGVPGMALLSSLLGTLGVVEFRNMRFGSHREDIGMTALNILGALLLINCFYFSFLLLILWMLWLVWRIIATIYSHHEHPEKRYAVDMAAQVYIALPLAMMNFFGGAGGFFTGETHKLCMAILAMFIIIWVNDTGAFIFGSLLGRHKLFERISPKKTWEGFFGGLLCSVAVGLIFGATTSSLSDFFVGNKLWFWGVAGLVISIFGTYGDLFESVIKRNLNLKDSGNLIPGHGGILDRIDSLLVVIPAMMVYILLIAYLR